MEKSISKSREIAFNVLNGVFSNKAYSTLSLRYSEQMQDANREDKALATEIVYGTIRNLIYIDHVLAKFLRRKVSDMPILTILRMSAYQILFLQGVPTYAICDQAVRLAEVHGHSSHKGFVNAVLRNVIRSKESISAEHVDTQIAASMPDLIFDAYIKTIQEMYTSNGEPIDSETALSLAEKAAYATTYAQEVTIRANTLKMSTEAFEQAMEDLGVEYKALPLMDGAYRLEKGGDVQVLVNGMEPGSFAVQDPSSMMPPLLLDPNPGDLVLDLCSAPGSKTMLMAQQMDNKGKIVACDIHDFRVKLVDNVAKLQGVDIVETRCVDVSKEQLVPDGTADCILADVPCSGLGVIGKKPEIKYSVTQKDIEDTAELQLAILERQWPCLKEGGTLVYSTCTCALEENLGVIRKFMEKHPECQTVRTRAFAEVMSTAGRRVNLNHKHRGMVQIMPGLYNADGFFVAKLRKGK